MPSMLCRNRVADFSHWKAVLDSHAEAHRAYGLRLTRLWREAGDENNVFFLFQLESIERAKAFINAPEAAEAGRHSGVIDGDYHFILPVDGTDGCAPGG